MRLRNEPEGKNTVYRREATLQYDLQRGCPLNEAEDLTQEVQLRVWIAQQRAIEMNTRSWQAACRSVWCDWLRRKRRERG